MPSSSLVEVEVGAEVEVRLVLNQVEVEAELGNKPSLMESVNTAIVCMA